MRVKILAFIVFATLFPYHASATFITGAMMLDSCENEDIKLNAYCRLYLKGISDAHDVLDKWNKLDTKQFCLPAGVTDHQLRKVFINYANENPQGLHHNAASMAMNAFFIAFPC